jgi:hypothetical protein
LECTDTLRVENPIIPMNRVVTMPVAAMLTE